MTHVYVVGNQRVKCNFEVPNSLNPKCIGLCQNGVCKEIIIRTCPEMFYAPDIPIAFGHVYFAFTKEYAINWDTWSIPPEYICYNGQLCGGFLPNVTLLSFNNSTCRRPDDFPLKFIQEEEAIGRSHMSDLYTLIFPNVTQFSAVIIQCVSDRSCTVVLTHLNVF
jgi:hypothetical protein